MKALFQALRWLVALVLFFLLFAFALNNQSKIQVNLLFGLSRQLPLILVILMAFAVGMVAGILGMLPHWLRQRRNRPSEVLAPAPTSAMPSPLPSLVPTQNIRPTSAPEYDYGP
jgi:lipopolysaccharide assembly protein A